MSASPVTLTSRSLSMDNVVLMTSRQPLSFITPSQGLASGRLDKLYPLSTESCSSTGIVPLVHGAPLSLSSTFAAQAPATPLSPVSPTPFGASSMLSSPCEGNKAGTFATPPQASRASACTATNGGVRGPLSPLRLDSPPSTGRLPSKKSKMAKMMHSPSDAMPPTPPMTPRYDLYPGAAEQPTSPSPPPKPATVSARALQFHTLHPLFANTYTLCEELGSGGFGFVVRAERNHDGLSVAVKFIERAKIPSHGWVKSRSWGETPGLTQPTGPKLVPMEAFVLRSIRHEGVVAFVDLFEDEKYFYLVMEHHGTPWQIPEKESPVQVSLSTGLASSAMAPILTSSWPRLAPGQQPNLTPTSSPTMASPLVLTPLSPSPNLLAPPRPAPMERRSSCDLFECIEQYSRFDEATAKYVFAQIVEIVYSLGRMGICHRDLKDENLTIDHRFRVKLIDFGSAVIFDPRQPSPLYQRFHGTQSFASAEILRGEPYQAPPSEVWSLGVLLSILVTGECPFTNPEAAKIGSLWRPKIDLNPEVEHLLHACLEVDIAKRITVSQIRRHPWLASLFHPR